MYAQRVRDVHRYTPFVMVAKFLAYPMLGLQQRSVVLLICTTILPLSCHITRYTIVWRKLCSYIHSFRHTDENNLTAHVCSDILSSL
jgi:hypothetical protein